MNKPKPAGLSSDPQLFKLMTEIDMIAHLGMNTFERVLPEGLTKAQFGVLNHLLRLDSRETIGELAAAFQVAQPTMSSTVKKLEAKAYVEFIPDTEDRRIKRVAVTPAGRAIREQAVMAVRPHLDKLQAAIPDADWGSVLPLLTRLRAFLEAKG